MLSLGPLSMLDRKEIVQKELAMYGKKLSDSAFNNQVCAVNRHTENTTLVNNLLFS